MIDPGMEKPFGVPPEFPDYFRLMTDMMLVAFKADITRISTIMIGREGSTRAYPEIGIADGHHPLTHHMGNMEMLDKVRQINVAPPEAVRRVPREAEGHEGRRFQPARSIDDRLRQRPFRRQRSYARQLPTLLAGRGGNFLNPGRHIIYQRETPVANLFATMIERVGVRAEHVGDSTGRLAGLSSARAGNARSISRQTTARRHLQHFDEPAGLRAGSGRTLGFQGKRESRMGSVCVVGSGLRRGDLLRHRGRVSISPVRVRNANQVAAPSAWRMCSRCQPIRPWCWRRCPQEGGWLAGVRHRDSAK